MPARAKGVHSRVNYRYTLFTKRLDTRNTPKDLLCHSDRRRSCHLCYHLFIAAILFVLGSFTWNSQDITQLRVLGQIGDTTVKTLVSGGLSVKTDGLMTSIDFADKEQAIRALTQRASSLTHEVATAELNIANKATTRTAEGTPYRRRIPVYNEAGRLLGLKKSSENFNWVYDPLHPDATIEGPKAGYVAKPNINLVEERSNLNAAELELKTIHSLLRKLDPDIVIAEAPNFAPAKLIESDALDKPEPATSNSGGMIIEGFSPLPAGRPFTSKDCLIQSNAVSSGQTCVAEAINWMSDSNLTDLDIDKRYGFQLLEALKRESKPWGLDWKDAGNVGPSNWPAVEKTLTERGYPVMVALNGPEFSPSGRGEIFLLVSAEGDRVTYSDSRTGSLKTTTKQAIFNALSHPDGNFVFLPFDIPKRPEGASRTTAEECAHVFPKLSPTKIEGVQKYSSTRL